jgi:hypothetical protein
MIRLHITVDDIDNVIAAGYTQYHVFTDTSSTGTFSTRDGTGTLVAAQTGYSYVDTDGDSSTYYKVAYWGGTPGTSSYSSVLQGGVAQYYVDALDVRQELAAGASDDAAIGEHDDDIIWDMCEEASRLIDDYKRVEHGAYLAGSSTSARYFTGSGKDWLFIDPFVDVDAVEVEETDGTFTSWTADTRVRVTGVPGISATVPSVIARIAKIQVQRWYKRAQQGWQDAGASIELGQLMYTQELDPDIKVLLDAVFPHTKAGI